MAFTLTPKRLELLQAIADGAVTEYAHWLGKKPNYSTRKLASGAYQRITGRVNELHDAELVRLGRRQGPSIMDPRPWELTDAGRAALAGKAGHDE